MKLFSEHRIYEVVYRGNHYTFMRFIRMDNICDICYFTLKNTLTGEMFTFEQSGILGIRVISERYEASAS